MKNPKRITDVRTEELSDGLGVFNLRWKQSYVLNATSALVWQHCDGKTTTQQLTELVQQKMNIPADQAERLMLAALEELDEADLLEIDIILPKVHTRRELFRAFGAAGLSLAILPFVSPAMGDDDDDDDDDDGDHHHRRHGGRRECSVRGPMLLT